MLRSHSGRSLDLAHSLPLIRTPVAVRAVTLRRALPPETFAGMSDRPADRTKVQREMQARRSSVEE